MIFAPNGWTTDASTGVVRFVAPGGINAGLIEYSERQRPVRLLSSLITQGPIITGFLGHKVGPIQRVITKEGEYGAIVEIDGEFQGLAARGVLACVFGDDFYNRIAGVASHESDRIGYIVLDIARSDAQFFGRRRRRRFVYAPPAGWQALHVNLETTWFPSDYPGHAASITVQPAMPNEFGVRAALCAALMEDVTLGSSGDVRLAPENRFGLRGELWRREYPREQGLPWLLEVIILCDDSFCYPFRYLGLSDERDRDLFFNVIGSAEPIPTAEAFQGSALAVAHWNE